MRKTPLRPGRKAELKRTSDIRRSSRLRAPGTPARTDRGTRKGFNSTLKPGKPLKVRKVSKRFADQRQPEWCAFVRGLPCILTGLPWHVCAGDVECCHVRTRAAGGADEGNTFPACRGAHQEQHYIGVVSFERKYGVDLAGFAAALARWAA